MRLFYWSRVRLFALTIASLLLFILSGWSQSNIKLSGYVYDKNSGLSLVGANIVIEGTGYHTVSDSRGYFSFNSIPVGKYGLTVSSIGYISQKHYKIIIDPDLTTHVKIYLEKEVYYLGKIEVVADNNLESTDDITVIFRDEIEKCRARSTSDILKNLPGVQIQQAGVSGSKSQIRIRGCDPKHVLVLLDGHKINSSGDGTADLNSIPVDIIERIEVHKGGGSAHFGADALGGVINIISQKSFLSKQFSAHSQNVWGRWDGFNNNFTINDLSILENMTAKLSYNHKSSVGEFPFGYTTERRDTVIQGTRTNNELISDNYFISGIVQFNKKFNLSYSGQAYFSEQGLPGRADRQDSLSYMRDNRYLVSGQFKYDISDNQSAQLEIGYSRFLQDFVGADAPVPFDSEYDNDIATVKYSHRFQPFINNQIQMGIDYQRDILDHCDNQVSVLSMHKTIRDNVSVYANDIHRFDIAGMALIDGISVNGAMRFDYSLTAKDSTSYKDKSDGNRVDNISPNIGIAITKGGDNNYKLHANYGKSFSLPSLNAIFWKTDVRSDGNPGLKPELSEHSEIELILSGKSGSQEISLGATYFYTFVKDLIVWIPIYNSWRPEITIIIPLRLKYLRAQFLKSSGVIVSTPFRNS